MRRILGRQIGGRRVDARADISGFRGHASALSMRLRFGAAPTTVISPEARRWMTHAVAPHVEGDDYHAYAQPRSLPPVIDSSVIFYKAAVRASRRRPIYIATSA